MSDRSAVLIVNANPLLNLVLTESIRLNEINRVDAIDVHAEGKGVNVARVLGRLSHAVTLTGFAGGHSGAWLKDLLRLEGVHEAMIETQAALRLGFMASPPGTVHPTSVLPNGFKVTRSECDALLKVARECLDGGVHLMIISGSIPDPVAAPLYPDLLELAASFGVPCWLDAHGEGLRASLQGRCLPDLAKPNAQEFAQVSGWNRIKEVHLTDGDQPAKIFIEGKVRYRLTPPPLVQVNPIGCGDCYLAGLAHGFLMGWPPEERYRFASACGAANARRPDVAQISPDEITDFLASVTLEPVETFTR